jgi:hypothetical protein
MHGGKRAGAGREAANIDLEELEKLCLLHCTDDELAAWFGVNIPTIQRRRQKQPVFAALMPRGRAKGCITVHCDLFAQAGERLGEVWDAAA